MTRATTVLKNESNAVDAPLTVQVATWPGTASPGDQHNSLTQSLLTGGNDYNSQSQIVSFNGTAGETQTFSVAINNDGQVEEDETLAAAVGPITAAGRAVSPGTASAQATFSSINQPVEELFPESCESFVSHSLGEDLDLASMSSVVDHSLYRNRRQQLRDNP